MLYLIGLGLSDEKDVTVRGLEAIKGSTRVYLEAYTSILGVGQDRLEAFYGKPIIVADRDMVETQSDDILADAHSLDVSFLVVGDPFGYGLPAPRPRSHRPALPPMPTCSSARMPSKSQ